MINTIAGISTDSIDSAELPVPAVSARPAVEQISHAGRVLAILIPNTYQDEGIQFFTPSEYSQQLAYMHYAPGKEIAPHFHPPVLRQITITQEVLVIRKGKVRVDFYDEKQVYVQSRILRAGDVVLLVSGGHGLEVLEELEMIEVKQGPYSGEGEKARFEKVPSHQIKFPGDPA